MCVCAPSFSCVWLCDPMNCSPPGSSVQGIVQQECWSGCHFLLQGIFLTQGLNLCLLRVLHWQADSLPPRATWEALNYKWVQSQKCARICVCGPEKGLINGGCFPFGFLKRYFRTSASFNSFCFHGKKKGSKECQGSTKSLCILLVQRILFCLRFMSVHFYRSYYEAGDWRSLSSWNSDIGIPIRFQEK